MKIPGPLCALVLLGCAHAPKSDPIGEMPSNQPRASESNVEAFERACGDYHGTPVAIAYEDAPGGAAIMFSTSADPVELRARVTELARYHNGSEAKTELHDLKDLPHTARVEELSRGARLILVAQAQNDADALRRHVQEDVTLMKKSGCEAGHEAL